MKRYNFYILTMAIMLLATSCSDDMNIEQNVPVTEYNNAITDVTFSLQFSNQDELQSRAGEDQSNYENYVDQLNIFVFASNGAFEKHYEFELNDMTGNVAKEITLEGMLSGTKYIHAVANLNSSNYEGEMSKILSAAQTSRESFLNAVVTMSQQTEGILDGRFLMSGSYVAPNNDNGTGLCNVPKEGGKISGEIQLIRVLAPVKFIVKSKSSISFVPTSWQVCNLPQSAYLYEKDNDATSSYFDTEEYAYKSNTNEVTFYMMENRKSPTTTITSFKDRMKYANENSTYFVLKGKYKGTADYYEGHVVTGDKSTQEAEASVTYYIPLGYINGNLNDYNIRRNTKYTYTVTVNGVNDIVLEVVDENEDTSVEDGDVIYTQNGKVIDLDAHYENGVLVFNKTTLQSKAEIGYRVKTPYTNGEYVHGEGADDDWVKFQLHSISSRGNYDKGLMPYPGDESEQLMTVSELMSLLQDAKVNETSFDNNGDIYVSCYVNEYYYENREAYWWEFTDKPNREMLLLCDTKGPINGSTLTDATYILSQKSIQTIFKTDGSVSKAWGLEWVNETDNIQSNYGINSDNADRNNSTANFASDNNDGRRNMLEEIATTGAGWDDISTWNWDWNSNSQGGNYRKAYLACMSRNRSSDGGTEIKNEDVKWYLASINQYQDMWIGSDAIDPSAQLYTYPTPAIATHYFSNSLGQFYWAEEGCAVSPYHEHNGRYQVGGTSMGMSNRKHAIRCIRNLNAEFITDNQGNLTVDYAEVSSSGNGYKIELPGLNDKAARSATTNSLTEHTERDEQNKPYIGGLEYYPELTQAYGSNSRQNYWENVALGKEGTYGCPEGYRIPSQKELILMKSKITDSSFTNHELISKTMSSYYNPQNPGEVNHPLGYWVGGYVLHLYEPEYSCVLVTQRNGTGDASGHNNYYLRCVKDNR